MARAGFSSQLGNHHEMVSAWVDVALSRTAAPNINCRFMVSSVRYSLKASIFFDTLRQTIDRESFRIIESGDRLGVLCWGLNVYTLKDIFLHILAVNQRMMISGERDRTCRFRKSVLLSLPDVVIIGGYTDCAGQISLAMGPRVG